MSATKGNILIGDKKAIEIEDSDEVQKTKEFISVMKMEEGKAERKLARIPCKNS